jgi:3-oxoacyl-[acyl-carrier protein] reductase
MSDEKVTLITGASCGLGKAILETLIQDGHKVAFTWNTSTDQTNKLIASYGDRVKAFQADATSHPRAVEVVRETITHFGKLDALVCNVGGSRDRPIWENNEQGFDFTIKTTLYASYNYLNAVAPYFKEQQGGKIVCIGSINGLRGREGNIGYCAAKAGLVGLVKTAAKELGEFNVNVNLVAPGYIDVESQQGTSELIKQLVLDECAIRRLSKPSEIADVVTFLLSAKAKNITGQTISVDCGQYI